MRAHPRRGDRRGERQNELARRYKKTREGPAPRPFLADFVSVATSLTEKTLIKGFCTV
jgi:hypothetical protein